MFTATQLLTTVKMNLKNMKTGQKWGLIFSVIIGLLLILTSLSYMRVNQLALDIDGIANDRYPKIVLAHTIRDELGEITRNMRSILLTTDALALKKEYASIEESNRIIGKSLETLNQTVNSARGRELLHATVNAREEFLIMTSSFLSLVREDKKELAQELLLNQLWPVQRDLTDDVNKLFKFQSGRMTAMAEETARQVASTRLLITIMILALTICTVSALLAYFSSRNFKHPFEDAAMLTPDAADDDLKHMPTPEVHYDHGEKTATGMLVYLDEYKKKKAAQTGQQTQENRFSAAGAKTDE
ncbi:MCP four helix bundle domain-containing protein [Undibacterium sp. Ji50W]